MIRLSQSPEAINVNCYHHSQIATIHGRIGRLLLSIVQTLAQLGQASKFHCLGLSIKESRILD